MDSLSNFQINGFNLVQSGVCQLVTLKGVQQKKLTVDHDIIYDRGKSAICNSSVRNNISDRHDKSDSCGWYSGEI